MTSMRERLIHAMELKISTGYDNRMAVSASIVDAILAEMETPSEAVVAEGCRPTDTPFYSDVERQFTAMIRAIRDGK